MNANAIMFAQPTLKVYMKLPPSREEISEVLAIVFTGGCEPSDEDFARTPLLVRRNKVAAALEWLKLNHEAYDDLEISEENLRTYALRDVIVKVDYRKTEMAPHDSVPNEARSVFDSNEEHGTTSGDCTFVVHGLTGAEYSTATMKTIIAVALQHLTNKGKMLGVGRKDVPESLYNNVACYPAMFPWLFPYGKGGIGPEQHSNIISDLTRKRSLLLYHDKRFQTDTYFPIIAFNHEQIKSASQGSRILVKRSKFHDISRRLLRTDPVVVADIADRLVAGEHVKPETDAEKQCFDLLRDLDGIGAHVPASATSKKHMRNEIWSMTGFFGAPTWFVTLAWSDLNHPIALYYAQTGSVFRPDLRTSDERNLLMSRNPVAAARFFNFMVQIFLKDVLGWQSEDGGLYGHTEAYYATVEQQGRLTLHLHSLLWIKNSLSPQEIRDRVMSDDSNFRTQLMAYLESACKGEFLCGSFDDVETKVASNIAGPAYYRDPTQTLPEVPPPMCEKHEHEPDCVRCMELEAWRVRYEQTVDDILYRVNIHDCRESVTDQIRETEKKNWRKVAKPKKTVQKATYERRGCLVNGVCKARFPRDVFKNTEIDEDGHINMRKLEPNMNTVTPILTYLAGANTDVTSLLSGTAVKAVISYVSDYVSKLGLKTYQAFASVYDVFERNEEVLNGGAEPLDTAKNLMRQMINSMSTKMEIGSPMAAMYLLDNPDHYASHAFVNFTWRSYVAFVLNHWNPSRRAGEENEEVAPREDFVSVRNEDGNYVAASVVDHYRYRPLAYESLSLYEWVQCSVVKARTSSGKVAFKEEVAEHERYLADMSNQVGYNSDSDHLSDFISNDGASSFEPGSDTESSAGSDSESEWDADDDDDIIVTKQDRSDGHQKQWRPFISDKHPLFWTHEVRCDLRNLSKVIPNFIGGALPRADKGDRDYYCSTMMTLFKPWRSPAVLKGPLSSWDDAFREHVFSSREQDLIRNFNLRYECNDARDDHYAEMKRKMRDSQFGFTSHFSRSFLGDKDEFANDPDAIYTGENDDLGIDEGELELGKKTATLLAKKTAMEDLVDTAKWQADATGVVSSVANATTISVARRSRNTWANVIKEERKVHIANKLANLPDQPRGSSTAYSHDRVDILDHDYFLPKQGMDREASDRLVRSICDDEFTLNAEQKRAFYIIADHVCSAQKAPLKMYIGGMGGSGKSQVIQALIRLFVERKEEHRFMVLGPTGSTAALLKGSTYHSVFRIPRDSGKKSKNRDDVDGIRNEASEIAAVNERLQGVEYIFLDEISMVSCTDLQGLASQAARARNVHDVEFGGLNVIFAGDFAQLPPTTGVSLYFGKVALRTNASMNQNSQNAVLGRILWHQFNTVVLLRQNMRQDTQSKDDERLRTALENMRYAACTSDDLDFLRSRIAGGPGKPNLGTPNFRYVSIITALNIHKDAINDHGAEQFARDTGQELVDFYSVDKLSSKDVNGNRWSNCRQSNLKRMGKNLQHALWNAPPSTTSDHIAGKLRLCIGMPVMIRVNEATELCMTKGQEGVVVAWHDIIGPAGQRVLDTLFVELTNPPKPVQIPGLPLNVVPLCRTSTAITCLLPDDSLVPIMREQVLVLLNFAMTDYASQGKSRKKNVVHLNNCKDHRAVYVALSRGTSAADTVIMQAFDERKITSGMTGYLRQEFRELELLDEITRLRTDGKLPSSVCGIYRGQLLKSYKQWKSCSTEPSHFHPAIRWNGRTDSGVVKTDYGEWKPTFKEAKKRTSDSDAPCKRKAPDMGLEHRKRAKLEVVAAHDPPPSAPPIPNSSVLGLIWDSRNYSCGYDTLFTPLAMLLTENAAKWTAILSDLHPLLGLWASNINIDPTHPENARDVVRRILHWQSPESFPTGAEGIRLDDLYMATTNRVSYGNATTVCLFCGFCQEGTVSTLNQLNEIGAIRGLTDLRPAGYSLTQYLEYIFDRPAAICPRCKDAGYENRLRRRTILDAVPSILILTISDRSVRLDQNIYFHTRSGNKSLRLRALVYFERISEHVGHFTNICLDKGGGMWYHDGIATRRSFVGDGNINSRDPLSLHSRGRQQLSAAIYAEDI
jgi:hypothetical protein